MEYLINDNVIFVEGAKNACIYDLNQGNVFSINEEAKTIIKDCIIHSKVNKTKIEQEYIQLLQKNGLYALDYNPSPYKNEVDKNIKLNFCWLEITQACNLRCVHCYEGNTHISAKKTLSFEEWQEVIRQIKALGCNSIQFIGGEPTAYKELIGLIDTAVQVGIEHITLFTNATLITEELFACIVKNNINISFSLYGHNACVHESVTKVAGSFEKTIKNVKRLQRANVKIRPAVVIMRENEDYVEEIKSFIGYLGLKYEKYDIIRNVYGGCQGLHTPQRKDVISKSFRSKPEFSITKEKFEKAFIINTCWYGKFAITETGDVIPCVFERNITYGNILDGISKILSSAELKKYWFLDINQIDQCNCCEYRYACKDCRPLGISKAGNIFEKNPRCTYDPLLGEWSNAIKEGE